MKKMFFKSHRVEKHWWEIISAPCRCDEINFPRWRRTFIELSEFSKFRKLINHWRMNWAQFKDPASQTSFTGQCGSILVSYITGGRFEPFYCSDKSLRIQWNSTSRNEILSNMYSNYWFYKCNPVFTRLGKLG